MLSLLLLPRFLIFNLSYLRVLLFVQVFEMKSTCNLILLGKSIICKFLFLLLSSLFFAAPPLVIYMYTYITQARIYVWVHACTPHQLFFISQILFLKNLKQDELVSAVHCFKLTVVACISPPSVL